MRLRHIPGVEEEVLASPYVFQEPESRRGRWDEAFPVKQPLRLEIGMGKGKFISQLAAENPGINYIGIEAYPSVMIKAVGKQAQLQLPNLGFLWLNAVKLEEVFAPGEVDRIYLNFSDPWPKDRHAKRRLTAPGFLKLYKTILAPDGCIEFKTDNTALFDWSVESVREAGWTVTALTHDLHHDPELCAGNIMTEYEEKFSGRGQAICKMIFHP